MLNDGNGWSLSLAPESRQVQEEDLVQQAVSGNQQAFARLYESYFEKIYRYVYLKIGDREEAEDMTQQVFLQAYRSVRSFKYRGTPFSAWLFRIAHNQMVDFLRKKSKKPLSIDVEETNTGEIEDPEATAELNINIQELCRAAKCLTKAQQEVISLRFSGGLSIEQVARVMGKSEGAVKALQHAAVLSLRKLLVIEDDTIKTNT